MHVHGCISTTKVMHRGSQTAQDRQTDICLLMRYVSLVAEHLLQICNALAHHLISPAGETVHELPLYLLGLDKLERWTFALDITEAKAAFLAFLHTTCQLEVWRHGVSE